MDNKELLEAMDNCKKNNSKDDVKLVLNLIKKAVFYLPIGENNSIGIMKSKKTERTYVLAFTSKEELIKWSKNENTKTKDCSIFEYSDILNKQGNNIYGLLIDPFGVNFSISTSMINSTAKSIFDFSYFNGTYMPLHKQYDKIIINEDKIIIETEKEKKEDNKNSNILKLKQLFERNMEKIRQIKEYEDVKLNSKSSSKNEFSLKIDGKLFNIDNRSLNKTGKELYTSFMGEVKDFINNIFKESSNVNNDRLIEAIKKCKENNRNMEYIRNVLNIFKESILFSPFKESNGIEQCGHIINNRTGENFLLAFSDTDQLKKWSKGDSDCNIKECDIYFYSRILRENFDGLVIDPFGINFPIPKNVILGLVK